MIKENIEKVRGRMAQACKRVGRDPSQVRLICVTKEATVEQIREVISCGITDVGENRVQDALKKYQILRDTSHESERSGAEPPRRGRAPIKWHMIGHLQTNKAKQALKIFDLVHSVDSLHLAEVLSKQAESQGKQVEILIQVNTSGEETKFGVSPEGAEGLIRQISKLEGIKILGLMTMAPFVKDPELTRPCFRKLKQLSEKVEEILRVTSHESRATILSMGMTQDFEVAVEEGSNMVRIGSAIFKG